MRAENFELLTPQQVIHAEPLLIGPAANGGDTLSLEKSMTL